VVRIRARLISRAEIREGCRFSRANGFISAAVRVDSPTRMAGRCTQRDRGWSGLASWPRSPRPVPRRVAKRSGIGTGNPAAAVVSQDAAEGQTEDASGVAAWVRGGARVADPRPDHAANLGQATRAAGLCRRGDPCPPTRAGRRQPGLNDDARPATGAAGRASALVAPAEDRGFEPLRALTQHAFQVCAPLFAVARRRSLCSSTRPGGLRRTRTNLTE
jgi:hypothetical protein